jgi:hypothetical protein
MSKEKLVTHEIMLENNGKNYNHLDIRTYTCKPLANDPSTEVGIHLSLYNSFKNGRSVFSGSWSKTPYGGHFCESSVEFSIKIRKMALNFPKASNFNQVKLMKNLDLPSLYPSWMMERYKKHKNVIIHHNTPLYYDTSTDKFILFLDTEFFRETTPTGLNFGKTEHTDTYKGKDGKLYAAFRADSMKELLSCMSLQDENSSFCKYTEIYKQRFLDAANAERVICLAMKTESHHEAVKNNNNGLSGNSIILNSDAASKSNRKVIQQLVIAQKVEFEIYQGALIDNLIYLMDEEGNINPTAIICSVKHQRQRKEIIKIDKHDDFTYLMMPYTETDWNLLKEVHKRMFNLMKELSDFFVSGYSENELLDMPVSQIAEKTPKLLR